MYRHCINPAPGHRPPTIKAVFRPQKGKTLSPTASRARPKIGVKRTHRMSGCRLASSPVGPRCQNSCAAPASTAGLARWCFGGVSLVSHWCLGARWCLDGVSAVHRGTTSAPYRRYIGTISLIGGISVLYWPIYRKPSCARFWRFISPHRLLSRFGP